jgi:heat shock protein HtpX
MAHELAHVKNRDTLTMTVTATIAGAIAALANFALFFGGGRRGAARAASSDAGADDPGPHGRRVWCRWPSAARANTRPTASAPRSRRPAALASALQKIEAYAKRIDNHQAERNPASGHMFIINPLAGRGADNLFSTHPATGNRVEALLALGVGQGTRRTTTTAVPVSGGKPAGPWG